MMEIKRLIVDSSSVGTAITTLHREPINKELFRSVATVVLHLQETDAVLPIRIALDTAPEFASQDDIVCGESGSWITAQMNINNLRHAPLERITTFPDFDRKALGQTLFKVGPGSRPLIDYLATKHPIGLMREVAEIVQRTLKLVTRGP